MFREHLPKRAYEMTELILRHQYAGDMGYNPGSQMIQIAGISVLSPLDHYIKEKLRVKLYLRYMDDFILMHQSESYLERCKSYISEYLTGLRMELHPEKTRVYPAKEGVKFLGFTHRLTESGRIVRIINHENVRAERKRLCRMVNLAMQGKLTKTKVDACYMSWKAHAAKGNTFKLLRRMDAYYKGLW